jgi:hypothetical protein
MQGAWCKLVFGLLVVLSGAVACDASCEEEARTYEDGAVWTCSDGCNGCSCNAGTVTSTLMLCPSPPGPAANKLSCWDRNYWQQHGTFWTCAQGCCSCSDGAIQHTPGECAGSGD